jgi:hypothetical protein
MTEITVEDIDTEPSAVLEPVEQQVAEPPEPPPPEPPLERLPTVAFQTSQGEEVSFAAAPKKRGRPKGKAKPKVRPSAPVEEYVEPEAPAQPAIDVNALMEPIFKAYMATHELRKREQRNARYHDLFSGMTGY